MSRRDIIIIAVLLNAAVLSFLFLTATRPEEEQTYRPTIESFIALDSVGVSPEQLHSEVVVMDKVPRDEVDNVLKPFLNGQTAAKLVQEPGTPHIIQIEDHDAVVIRAPEPASSKVVDSEPVLEVVVKRGDVLEKIARVNGTTVKEIKRLNNLTNDRISIGQVLRLPGSSAKSDTSTHQVAKPIAKPVVKEVAKVVKPVDPVASDVQFYTVQPGDNPWKIARQNKVQLDELLRLNGLTEDTARNIKIGDKLRVR